MANQKLFTKKKRQIIHKIKIKDKFSFYSYNFISIFTLVLIYVCKKE